MALKILSLSTLLLIGNISMVNANPNMRFYGELVDDPCVINPGDETVILTFGNVPENFFYTGIGRTDSQGFEIHLSECDLSINKKVRVTFKGDENQAMAGKGFLALSPGSRASGIAIGLEDANGSPLRINQQSSSIALDSGSSVLKFSAFIQAEPAAITNQSIRRGRFSAIATFHLNYD
ncbi:MULTISPECIES: fimbrial protein [Proteus]|uniref:Fimbrial protein n=1 Tax=Proteus appendicitidis TaxID=3034648 RepID=A0ABY8YA23_9GAMM|nr:MULTISPECIES: fimbrial protein [Proteus]MBG6028545.1 type 1 fimbrial protein [Proteus mirabilis]MBG6048696.1 type 1 fimbrial protein [Proteus mirabilis]QEZ91369.1 exotoxin [Proteus sp. CD3]WIV89269.1 fimbrial protein [Proteus sp. HZ0627]